MRLVPEYIRRRVLAGIVEHSANEKVTLYLISKKRKQRRVTIRLYHQNNKIQHQRGHEKA